MKMIGHTPDAEQYAALVADDSRDVFL
jgi:hypothetical protein